MDSLRGVNRPVIGICTNLTRAQWGAWDQQAALLPFNYITSVQRAGGLALMIAPDPRLVDHPDEALDLIDGLLLAGGEDIDPSFYNGHCHSETGDTVPERDRVEIALSRRAVERDMPVLGVCRGMQLLDVAFGGTLVQHLPDEVGHGRHRVSPGSFEGSEHDVRLDPGSLAARAAGGELRTTNSHHHQGIDELGEGFRITGHATLDELAEAIEAPSARFVLGVQWHPEAEADSQVIESFVEAAAAYRSTRGSP